MQRFQIHFDVAYHFVPRTHTHTNTPYNATQSSALEQTICRTVSLCNFTAFRPSSFHDLCSCGVCVRVCACLPADARGLYPRTVVPFPFRSLRTNCMQMRRCIVVVASPFWDDYLCISCVRFYIALGLSHVRSYIDQPFHCCCWFSDASDAANGISFQFLYYSLVFAVLLVLLLLLLLL